MKNLILFLALITLFTIDLEAQRRAPRNQSSIEKEMRMPASQQNPSNQTQGRSNTRYRIFEKTLSVGKGKYVDIKHYKNEMHPDYKYEVEVQVYSGDADLYIEGYGNGYRTIRKSTNNGSQREQSYYEKSDLKSHEGYLLVSLYGKYHGHSRCKVTIYKKYKGNTNHCDFRDPIRDLLWLKDIARRHPDYKISEYKIGHKTYFKVFKCNISHYKVYWYDCTGHKVCEHLNENPCHTVKNARFVKCWKDCNQTPNDCHFNDPIRDLSWLAKIKRDYPKYKICQYKYNHKTYFKIYTCDNHNYKEYWYNCNGKEVCKSFDRPCRDYEHATLVKCWYNPCSHNQHCTWDFWFDKCDEKREIAAGKDLYVKVNARKSQDIQWMDLYVNGQKIRREEHAPYEWGKSNSNGDHPLRNMQKGTYKLKCVVYDKCGKKHEKYCTVYVKNAHCNDHAYYVKGKHNSSYPKYSDVYVKVQAENHHDIEWMDLYVNGRKVRRENSAPYEWGRPNSGGDNDLRNMRPGTYKLKCVYKTKCGHKKEKYSTIYIKN